jgi:glucose/arabinose dehydrogenase
MKLAPNGDIFVAESKAGRIRVLHLDRGAPSVGSEVFADGLNLPFGIAFYPSGPEPRFIYIGNTDAILRFPYRNGDRAARGPAEIVMRGLPVEGHWTRDLVVAPDDRRLFVAVGSLSNDAEGLAWRDEETIRRFETMHGTGAAWGGWRRTGRWC